MPRIYRCLLFLLIFPLTPLIIPLSVKAQTPVNQCRSVAINPDKHFYLPGETVDLEVNSTGDVNNIEVRWVEANRNIIQQPYITQPITTGSFDLASQTWTGTWTVPNHNGEYLLVANIYAANGPLCSGNPGYACNGCETGTLAGSGITAGTLPCQGCNKVIVVNNNQFDPTSYPIKEYFNYSPGFHWLYQGRNELCGPRNNLRPCSVNEGYFQTLQKVEEQVAICGHPLYPLRLTKTNQEGYILPNTDYNFRKFVTYFEENEPWSAKTMGKLVNKSYHSAFNPAYPLSDLGTEVDPSQESAPGGNRHTANIWFNNTYFAPHFFSEDLVPEGYYHQNVDLLRTDTNPPWTNCTWSYDPSPPNNAIERFMSTEIHQTTVSTPTYSGPALRMSHIEARFPIGTGWYIREDWYLVRDLGRVKIDKRHLTADLCQSGAPHPDCKGDQAMQDPFLTMELSSYYIGGPLTITIDPPQVATNGAYLLTATSQQGSPYTGYLEAKTCISETSCIPGNPFKWGYGAGRYIWVQEGTAQVDLSQIPNHPPGLRHSYFRPWVETSPANTLGETRVTQTDLPWSQEVPIRVLSGNLPLTPMI